MLARMIAPTLPAHTFTRIVCPVCNATGSFMDWGTAHYARDGVCPGELCTPLMRRLQMEDGSSARACQIAGRLHGPQAYARRFPYTRHLLDVVSRVWFHLQGSPLLPQAVVVAAYHDVLEDTAVTLDALQAQIGEEEALLVQALSNKLDPAGQVDVPATLAAIRAAGPVATIVKVADRTANLHFSNMRSTRNMQQKYVDRFPTFNAALYVPDMADGLWAELEAEVARAIIVLRPKHGGL